MVDEIVGTIVGRWYVTLFGLIYLVLVVRYLGAKRAAIYTVIALFVGASAENSSVRWGFPYTGYSFNPELRGQELWIFDVPLIVPMCYTFGGYFAFAAARLIVSGPRRTRGTQPVLECLLAVVLATWAIWILDPVMRLGEFHLVGELFAYDGPGFWFGLPLGSQVGYFCTSAILVGVLTVMTRDEPTMPVRLLRHPQLFASLNYAGQVLFAFGSAVIVGRTQGGEPGADADALAGAALIIGIPMMLLVAIHWQSLRPADTSAGVPRQAQLDPGADADAARRSAQQ